MAKSRTTFVQHLQQEFNYNHDLQKKCINSSQAFLKRHIINRIFDDYPRLLSSDNFNKLHKQFIKLISSKIKNSDVKNYITSIIQLGRDELLDKDEKLKPEIIKLLGWQEFKDKIVGIDLLSAYISAVNAQIIDHAKPDILNNIDAYNEFGKIISENYFSWLKEHVTSKDAPSVQIEIPTIAKNISLAVSLGLLAYGIYKLVKFSQEEKKESKEQKSCLQFSSTRSTD